MLALNLGNAEELAEAFYLSHATAEQFNGRLGSKLWRDMKPKERLIWITAAERVVTLYRAEGLSIGPLQAE